MPPSPRDSAVAPTSEAPADRGFRSHFERLERIADTFDVAGADATGAAAAADLRTIAAELRAHITAEALITRLSSEFLALPYDQIDTAITRALAGLCAHAGTGRAYVFLLNADGSCLDEAYEWCADGVVGHDFSAFKGVPVTAFPWSMAQFNAGEAVIVTDPTQLPPLAAAELGACEALSIASYINVPLLDRGRVLGWLGFDAVGAPRGWSVGEQRLITLAGEVIVNGLLRKWAEARLHEERELAQVTVSSIRDAVLTTDAAGVIRYANPAALAMSRQADGDLAGRHLRDALRVLKSDAEPEPIDLVALALQSGGPSSVSDETVVVARDGRRFGVEDTTSPLRDTDGGVFGAVVVLRDVTDARRVRHEMAYQARHDALTDLHNRYELEAQLSAVVTHEASPDRQHALLYVDLDGFKRVNDGAGHLVGDRTLRQVAACLRARLRHSDVAARVGGDEFAIILRDCPLDSATAIAQDIVSRIGALEVMWDGRTYAVGASVGLTAIRGDAAPHEILNLADQACYRAKRAGGGRVSVDDGAAQADAIPDETGGVALAC